jgi:hypothetical protein
VVAIDRILAGGALLFACGCSGGSSGGTVIDPPDQVTATEVQAEVFGPRCALSGCHVGATAPFGLDLGSVASSTANTVGVASFEVPSLDRVLPGDADESYLYLKLTGDPRIQGDPMPASGGPLGPAELALVRTWIEQGAM